MKAKILLIVSGGIACFKACQLCSDLAKKYEVKVILTKNASEFVTPVTFATLTHNPCLTEMFAATEDYTQVNHINLAKWADLIVVAPLTANLMAKITYGLADDLASTTILARRCPVLLCPAMNTYMLENPITQTNIALLQKRNFQILQAASGLLACGDTGKGKLPDIPVIMAEIEKILAAGRGTTVADSELEQDLNLTGLTITVTAGPTQEAIDPVRFITNHSSGKMGYALASKALQYGAEVNLISGPVNLEIPAGVNYFPVKSAQEMLAEVQDKWPVSQILIKAAAVADYRVENIASSKIKKQAETLTLKLVKNPDILKWAGEHKQKEQVLCGFAMETENLLANARQKMQAKNCDLLVANDLTTKGAGFAASTNVATILWPDKELSLPLQSKEDLAVHILRACQELYRQKQTEANSRTTVTQGEL